MHAAATQNPSRVGVSRAMLVTDRGAREARLLLLRTLQIREGISTLAFESSLVVFKTPRGCRLLEQIHFKGPYFPVVFESRPHGFHYCRLGSGLPRCTLQN